MSSYDYTFANTNTNSRKIGNLSNIGEVTCTNQPKPLQMENSKIPPPTSIRDLMPDNYTVELAKSTGSKNVSNLSQIVRLEHTNSKYWPAVLKLAQETNPQGYATWAAANPDKVPVAQAA